MFGTVARATTSFYRFCLTIWTISNVSLELEVTKEAISLHLFFFVFLCPLLKEYVLYFQLILIFKKTIRQLKKQKKKKKLFNIQGKSTESPSEKSMPPKSLKFYVVPSPDGIPTCLTMRIIEVANFEIKITLINMIQQTLKSQSFTIVSATPFYR